MSIEVKDENSDYKPRLMYFGEKIFPNPIKFFTSLSACTPLKWKKVFVVR